ncbi:MAG: serine endopeptidase [Limnobacter sp.]|nr:serine endopeptidase [Limnobacter sp.]
MSKTLRVSEKWYRRALWVVAFFFANFLIGLGGAVVGDLPQVEKQLTLDQFVDQTEAEPIKQQMKVAQAKLAAADSELDQARLKYLQAQSDTQAEQENFNNWVTTRNSTQDPEQDASLKARTAALEALQAIERRALQEMQNQQQIALDASQGVRNSEKELKALEDVARVGYEDSLNSQELRVFAYRLALTLPLLLLAAWLLIKKRHSTYWPFVWGFGFFAIFAFFVELVPYLPSYGGYVRQIVGIVLTVVLGRYAILGMNRYLAKQREVEATPEHERRQALDYDLALGRVAKSICPGCERPVNMQDASIDFCPHCGIGLHDHCTACNTRKSCFSRYCHSCGAGKDVKVA